MRTKKELIERIKEINKHLFGEYDEDCDRFIIPLGADDKDVISNLILESRLLREITHTTKHKKKDDGNNKLPKYGLHNPVKEEHETIQEKPTEAEV